MDAIIYYKNAVLKILNYIIGKNDKSLKLDFGYNKRQTVFLDVPQTHFKYYSGYLNTYEWKVYIK